jgi:hypothetical protein
MSYTNAEAQEELLDVLAQATDLMGRSLAAFGEAYEKLDDDTADRLEAELFGPAQAAYGRAKRTYTGFAERTGLPARAFEPQMPGMTSGDARAFIDRGVHAAAAAGQQLAELQDSMRPVEVGDVELRAGLAEVRELAGAIPGHARELLRTLGR